MPQCEHMHGHCPRFHSSSPVQSTTDCLGCGRGSPLAAALSPHPFTSYLGTTLLSDVLHCASEELQAGQLEELWQLLLEVAVTEAAVAHSLGNCWKTQQLLGVLAELTQVGMVQRGVELYGCAHRRWYSPAKGGICVVGICVVLMQYGRGRVSCPWARCK